MEMDCHIYKSSKKDGCYVFVQDPDMLENLPADVSRILGSLEFVMDIVLNKDTRFAISDPATIISAIVKHGFYIQLPPGQIK